MPDPRISRRLWIRWALVAPSVSGCGTILFPERRGQPAGALDWKIVALDGIGLLFFFVPGVIAFAVDFSNGTIYLPPGEYTHAPHPSHRQGLISRRVPQGELSPSKLNAIVSDHLQQPFQLRAGDYQTCQLQRIEEFWPTHATYVARANR